MKLKTTAILLCLATCTMAQIPVDESTLMPETGQSNSTTLDMALGYEHNTIAGSAFNTSMLFNINPATWVTTKAGIHVRTESRYAATAAATFKIHTTENRDSYFGIRNQYLYNIYASGNLHDFVISLAAAYSHPYFDIAIGGYARMFAPIKKYGASAGIIWEPGIVYDVEAHIFPNEYVWNIGAQITNMRTFEIERLYSPNFILKGNYRIGGYASDHLNFKAELGFKPAGLFHINATYYSFFINIGITCII